MLKSEIEKYKNKVVMITIHHGTHHQLRYGLPFFGNTGMFLYNGYEKPFVGYYENHYTFLELMQEGQEIPYDAIINISKENVSGVAVEEHLKNSFPQDFNNIKKFQTSCCDFDYWGTKYSNLYVKNTDHDGMIYNPYSDRWSYL